MPMTICRECKSSVSDAAKICPACGIKRPGKRGSRSLWIVGSIGAAIALFNLIPTPSPRPRTRIDVANDARRDADFEEDQQAATGAVLLRNSMRNPSKFDLSLVFIVDHEWFCYAYRAENGFGGMNLDRAVVHKEQLLIEADATGPWMKHCKASKGRKDTDTVKLILQKVTEQ